MIELILAAMMAYRNGLLAKRKGQKTTIWVIITLAAFVITYVIAAVVYIAMIFGSTGVLSTDLLIERTTSHPMEVVILWAIGVGGCLAVRYVLERMPDKDNDNNTHEEM